MQHIIRCKWSFILDKCLYCTSPSFEPRECIPLPICYCIDHIDTPDIVCILFFTYIYSIYNYETSSFLSDPFLALPDFAGKQATFCG